MLINTIENHRVVTWWWVERDSNVWLMMLLGKKYTRSTASTLSSLTDRGRCLKSGVRKIASLKTLEIEMSSSLTINILMNFHFLANISFPFFVYDMSFHFFLSENGLQPHCCVCLIRIPSVFQGIQPTFVRLVLLTCEIQIPWFSIGQSSQICWFPS